MIHIDVDTAVTVPVNIMPLMDDTDFITRETAITYNQAGMDLVWNFITSAGVITQTAVTPTTAGDYDWTHVGDGMYKIEIPASGGGSINNDTEGTGYFTGICTGVLAWRSPDICFRASALNDALIDGGDVLDVSVTELGGVAQSATDLKDFADAGYDPATNKVQGVVLVDTTTTNADMRGTNSAATAIALAAAQTDLDIITDTDGVVLGAAGVDLIWDEVLTGATHNVAASAGRRLRGITAVPTLEGTINDGSPTSTSFATTLTGYGDSSLSDGLLMVEHAADQWEAKAITSYTSSTGTFTFDEPFSSTLTNGDTISVQVTHIHTIGQIATEVWSTSGRALSDPAGFKKNTAVNNFTFLMIDSTDHVTPITGETVTAERSIDGAAFGACTNSVSEISDGMYKINFSAADMNGDIVAFKFTASGSDPRYITIATET